MTELAILIPVLGRPHRVKLVLESIRRNTHKPRVLFVCSPGDDEEIQAIHDERGAWAICDGNYAAKINHGVHVTSEPFLFFGADDLEFHPGWFEKAKEKMTDGIGVVATNDLCNARVMDGSLATHPLVTREYTGLGTVDDPEKPLHEGYKHEFVDREFSETASFRGAFAYAPDSVVEHLHPMVGKAPTDDLYDQMPIRMRQGGRLYGRRKHLWTSR